MKSTMHASPFSMPARIAARLLPLAAALALAGCGSLLHTDYATPNAQVPASYAARTNGAAIRADKWWTVFGDPQLNRMIDDALLKNNDLAVAAFKVRQAQLQAGIANDARIPALGASIATNNQQQLRNSSASTTTSSASLTLTYEADLWGRLSSAYDAKQWEALATEEDRRSVALTLIGNTANYYWKGAYLNERLALNADSIAYAQKTLDLVRTQYQAGYVAYTSVLSAEQNLLTQQVTRADFLAQQTQNNNALSILFDGPPGQAFTLPQRLPGQAIPTIEAGLPAEVLARRPDLRAAELRLRSTLSTLDSTRAGFYPTLSLTGALGGSSNALRNVLLNPYGALGATLTLPFLQWNNMQLTLETQRVAYDSAIAAFRQTLYTALGEVENALSTGQQYEVQDALQTRNLEAAREAERRYEIAYRAGSVTLQVWLEQQEKRRTAEATLVQLRLNRLNNQMTLYKALGGDAQVLPPQ